MRLPSGRRCICRSEALRPPATVIVRVAWARLIFIPSGNPSTLISLTSCSAPRLILASDKVPMHPVNHKLKPLIELWSAAALGCEEYSEGEQASGIERFWRETDATPSTDTHPAELARQMPSR